MEEEKIKFPIDQIKPENFFCADCFNKKKDGITWASTNLGILLCIHCCGIHRELGVHISKVKSLNLDLWKKKEIQNILEIRNENSNDTFLKNVENAKKIDENSTLEERKKYIFQKYESKIKIFEEKKKKNKKGKIVKKTKISNEGKIAFKGVLIINLKCGKDLIIQDYLTQKSDPFVILATNKKEHIKSIKKKNCYSGQIVKSKIIWKNLNPNWNETLTCSVCDLDSDFLQIEVWDKDLLKDDDFMGKKIIRLKDLKQKLENKETISLIEKLDGVKHGSIYFDLSYNSFI